ncbi:hypothetical protein BKP57_08870 [Virgibacillus sp. 6R]|nr:hypothetical protein BKP57_08870 [Virgibacillus sp. 6R]
MTELELGKALISTYNRTSLKRGLEKLGLSPSLMAKAFCFSYTINQKNLILSYSGTKARGARLAT